MSIACTDYGDLKFLAKLPKKLDEVSGIVYMKDSTIWAVQDNGNPDLIYQLSLQGKLLNELEVKNAKNHDWEDITKDPDGNLYIGDIGNNWSDRKDLVIYKIPDPTNEPGDKIEAEKIEFNYPEQKKFPPKKKDLKYDAEALFYHEDNLYIITKDRRGPFTGGALIYKVPAKKGNYEAQLVGNFTTCEEWISCQVTAADISPDGKKIILLGYGKLWLFTDFTFDDFSKGTVKHVDLGGISQLESISFVNDSTLLLADEETKGRGRNLYSYLLK